MNRVSVGRLTTLAVILVAGALAVSEPAHRTPYAIVTGLAVVLFIVLIRMTQRLDARRRVAMARAKVNEQAALRAERAWSQIAPQPWTWPADADEPLRTDLDVTGSFSLFHLLPSLSRALGAPLLRQWFASPSAAEQTERA